LLESWMPFRKSNSTPNAITAMRTGVMVAASPFDEILLLRS
jgi:hypothetical protein